MRAKRNPPVRLDLATESPTERTRWAIFKSWISSALGLPENRVAAEAAAKYAAGAYDAGLEKLRGLSVRNQQVEAEVARALAAARLSDCQATMDSSLIEGKRALLDAQATKTRAEAKAIELRAKLDVLEALNRLGLDIAPIMAGAELEGLFISRRTSQDGVGRTREDGLTVSKDTLNP